MNTHSDIDLDIYMHGHAVYILYVQAGLILHELYILCTVHERWCNNFICLKYKTLSFRLLCVLGHSCMKDSDDPVK